MYCYGSMCLEITGNAPTGLVVGMPNLPTSFFVARLLSRPFVAGSPHANFPLNEELFKFLTKSSRSHISSALAPKPDKKQ